MLSLLGDLVLVRWQDGALGQVTLNKNICSKRAMHVYLLDVDATVRRIREEPVTAVEAIVAKRDNSSSRDQLRILQDICDFIKLRYLSVAP